MNEHHFFAGVPATGKSLLGRWLAETRGYVHIDAEKDGGVDFDRGEVHDDWNDLIETGRAHSFVTGLNRIGHPVIIDWGFPTRFLYVVSALQSEGVLTWWFHAERSQARRAFLARGGINPLYFEDQMDDIAREWLRISSVFGAHIVQGLHPDGSQRKPEDLWSEISAMRI